MSASATALERRRERRIPVHLPIVVRGKDRDGSAFEERTASENICRGGAAFTSQYVLDLGTRLEIQIPVLPTSASEETEFSTEGRIVHLESGLLNHKSLIGVEFTGARFNRIYVSETT